MQDLSNTSENNIDPMALRLKELKEYYRLKQKQLGEIIGVPQSGLSNFLSGKEKSVDMNADRLGLLLTRFPEVSKDWLYDGKGTMLAKKYVGTEEYKTVDVLYVPEFASASFNNTIKPVNVADLCYMELMRMPGVDYTNRLVIPITGRSMEPTIVEGQRCLQKL